MSYLYNTVVLPALPEWDKTTYLYAAIVRMGSVTAYDLYCSTQPIFRLPDGGSLLTKAGFKTSGDVWTTAANPTNGVGWSEFPDELTGGVSYHGHDILWANHDVVYRNTTEVYLAASEPVKP